MMSAAFAIYRQSVSAAPKPALDALTAAPNVRSSRPVKRAVLADAALKRATTNLVGTAELICRQTRPDEVGAILGDILDMQAAVSGEAWAIGRNWLDGLLRLGFAAVDAHAANTLSKIAEQDFDLVGRFGELVTRQVTDAVDLTERASVGYAYWLSRKLAPTAI